MATSEDTPSAATDEPDGDLPVHGLSRSARAMWELLAAAGAGTVTGAAVTVTTPITPASGVLLAWDVAALVYLGWVWRTSWRLDADGTAAAAVREDPTRGLTRAILLTAAVTSLAAVVYTIAQASRSSGAGEVLMLLLGISSVAVSWFLVHTVFSLRYAREYFVDEDGGIDFNMHRAPVWSDFAYMAFTIGMTFQVADTDLRSSALRRIVLLHQLISYLFGTVVIAVAINILAGLTG